MTGKHKRYNLLVETRLIEQPLKDLFQRRFGKPAESADPLKGDGSDRSLFRLAGGGLTAIGVLNSDVRENAAFLEFSRHFRKFGLPVPEIYAEDLGGEAYLEEDLGDTTLFDFLTQRRAGEGFPEEALEQYRKAVGILPRFQMGAGKTLNYGACYPRACFDKQSMMWDLSYFKYYFLRLAHIPFGEQELEDDFESLSDFLLEADRDFFLYRDFQSRNIMIRDGRPWFIDYQGGRKGALQYDIASLLYDAKADLPFSAREKLLGLYLDAASELSPLDRGRFMRHYHGYVYIRVMQAMGAYGLRGFYERKSHFLQSVPYAIRNLEYLLRMAELPVGLPELTQVFKRLVASSALRQFGKASLKLTVRIQSFSYRDGAPTDEKGHGGGYVFDCRALPNPGKHREFAEKIGADPEVVLFLDREPAAQEFLGNVYGLIDGSVKNYQGRNFTDLSVGFGCTGGRHRSVYCAEKLARHLREKYKVGVELRHLELQKRKSGLGDRES